MGCGFFFISYKNKLKTNTNNTFAHPVRCIAGIGGIVRAGARYAVPVTSYDSKLRACA